MLDGETVLALAREDVSCNKSDVLFLLSAKICRMYCAVVPYTKGNWSKLVIRSDRKWQDTIVVCLRRVQQ